MTDRPTAHRSREGIAGLTAVVLAGGMGTRIRAEVGDRQKVMAELGGRPFVSYLLDRVAACGIGRAVLCTGYLGGTVSQGLGENYKSLRLAYSVEEEPLGTAGALRHALPLIESGTVLVLNGDSYCTADMERHYEWHRAKGAEGSLVLVPAQESARFGRVDIDDDDRVRGFREKEEHGGPGWVNAGMYVLSRSLVEQIPEGRPVSIERECFPAWCDGRLWGYRCEERFLDMGTPEDFHTAERFLAALETTKSEEAHHGH